MDKLQEENTKLSEKAAALGKQVGVKKESDGDDMQKGGGSYEEHLLQSEY